jgi:hypothetical protein
MPPLHIIREHSPRSSVPCSRCGLKMGRLHCDAPPLAHPSKNDASSTTSHFLQRLHAWKNQDAPRPPNYAWPGVSALVTQQDLIGWRAFLEGCVLQAWAAKQQEYYVWLERKNTEKHWVTTLIKRLWQISWDMWEHRRGELKSPSSPALLREHARLDARIAVEFDDIRSLIKKDRRWFRRPQEVLYTETIDYKVQWLKSVALARQRYSRRHQHDLTNERAAMRHFLIYPPQLPHCD